MKPSKDLDEQIDEILANLYNSAWVEGSNYKENNPEGSEIPSQREIKKTERAKQAITSLIKELVAEAKPGKYSSGESILNVDGIGEVDGYEGYNQAIDQFEHNLLKALEEV